MKIKKRLLSIITEIITISYFTLSVSAGAPSNMVTSTIHVNAGSSKFASVSIQKQTTSSTCYMRLRWFQFSGYNEKVMPSGNYIYSRLYKDTPSVPQASNPASFSQVTSPGNYNYSFLAGCGGLGQIYVLKTNSSYYGAYDCKIDWSPDAYT